MASIRDVVMGWASTITAADSGLIAEVSTHVYDTIAPQSVTPDKYVTVVPPRSIRNVMMMGARIIQGASDLWIIKMVGKNKEYSELEAGANRLRTLFHRGGAANNQPAPFPITVTGGTIHECYERDVLSYEENDAGIVYRHLGGLYFIAASAD